MSHLVHYIMTQTSTIRASVELKNFHMVIQTADKQSLQNLEIHELTVHSPEL